MVGPNHDTPDDTPDEGGAAPSDLLQMWISGRDAAAAPAAPRTATEAPPATESPEPTTETAPDADPEPAAAESVTDPDPAPAPAAAPAGRAPASSAPWASTPPPMTYGRTAAETAGSGAAAGSGWWPYAETASPAPDPVDPPATVAQPGPDGLHEDVESEWTSSDAPAVAEATTETADTAAPVENAAAGERPHWASFGEAQTAEEVLDRLGPGASLPGATASRPAAAPPPEAAQPESPQPEAQGGAEAEPATGTASDTDLSATTHWSLDDFEAYIRAQSNNELDSWMGSQATSSAPVEEAPVAEAPVEEPPVADTSAETAPAEEAPVEEPPVADTSADVTPAEETPTEEAPVAVEEPPAAEPEPAAPAPTSTWTPSVVHSVGQSSTPAAGAEVPVSTDDTAEDTTDTTAGDTAGDSWGQHDVEWDHVDAPATEATPQPEATDPEATQYAEFLREDETPGAPGPLTAAALEADPDSGTGPLSAAALEAGAEAPTDAPTDAPADAPADVDAPALYEEPAEEPEPISILEPTAPVEAVTEPEVTADAEPDAEPVAAPEPEPAAVSEPEPDAESDSGLIQAEHHPDPEADDYQEWHDDQGLRWVSHDGGYTWYSDDGQGWNAEIGEAIDVPAGYRPATVLATPSEEPTAPDTDPGTGTGAATVVDDTTDSAATDDPVDSDDTVDPVEAAGPIAHEHEPWSEEPAAPTAPEAVVDDVWPSTSSGSIPAVPDVDTDADTDTDTATQSMWPGEAPQALPPTEAIPTPAASEPAPAPTPEPTPEPVQALAASAPRASSLSPLADASPATTAVGADQIPPFVEYKPRGAYRPLLGVLFVAAAILAVVAIFWAVTQGSQAATGIAIGVAGFALAFWWGLLSWTPTIVSVSGSILEVARGSDGERFDLRSSRLMIDVDDDTGSRNWRTTITRPNGTELVIPASAVDPDEFATIVRHYRAETSHDQAQLYGR